MDVNEIAQVNLVNEIAQVNLMNKIAQVNLTNEIAQVNLMKDDNFLDVCCRNSRHVKIIGDSS